MDYADLSGPIKASFPDPACQSPVSAIVTWWSTVPCNRKGEAT